LLAKARESMDADLVDTLDNFANSLRQVEGGTAYEVRAGQVKYGAQGDLAAEDQDVNYELLRK
jgi:hypothetical protein